MPYLSYSKPLVLDMKWENYHIHVVEWANIPKLPLLLNAKNVLWLVECLTPTVSFDIFMNNYFTSFRLFTHLSVNNIRATCVLNKNRLPKCTIIWDKHLQKKGTWPLWTAHIKQKSSGTLTVVGWIDSSAINIASSESCERKRFVRCWNKVEKNIFKKNNQISSAATTRTWVLSTEWTKAWPSIDVQLKNGGGSRLFEWQILCCSGCGGYCTILTKIKAMSPCLY